MTTTLLLDADIVAFQLAATSQRSYKWPGLDAPAVAADDFDTLPERIDAEVSKLTKAAGAEFVIVCLSCPTEENWRLAVLPSYKGQRDYSQRPVHLGAIKDYLEANYPSYRRPGLEADDIMGILSTMRGLPKNFLAEHPQIPATTKKVIGSEDKDMGTIPGWLFNPAKDRAPRFVTEEQADRFHLYQTLVGDSVDHYAGCPGSGPEDATSLLDNPFIWQDYQHTLKSGPRKGQAETRWKKVPIEGAPLWHAVVSRFRKAGLTEQDALVQARVARICRASDYDFKNKEVILWTPSK